MRYLLLSIGLLTATSAAQATVATFEDLPQLAAESAFIANQTTTFTSGGINFGQTFTDFGSFGITSDWTYSNQTDTTTPGFGNLYSAITGSGVNGSSNYAVADAFDGVDIEFSSATAVNSTYITNTTFAFLAIQEGDDGNVPPFVSGPFGSDDFFTLTISAFDADSNLTGSIDVQLWDAVTQQALSEWLFVDLSSLGVVNRLGFSLSSSDTGDFGINTPAFFALDNLDVTAVPVPGAVWLFLSAMTLLFTRHPKHK